MPRRRQCAAALLWMAMAASLAAARQQPVDPNDPLTVPRITLEVFRAMHASAQVLVVDVRDELAFQDGHIPGAINVPLSEMERRADDLRQQAGARPIVTYCSCPSEHSSAEAGLILYAHRLKDVRALVGGYVEWVRAGGKVER